MHLKSELLGVALDGVNVLLRNGDGRDEAGGVAGVDAGLLDVLHDGGHEGFLAVANGVGFRLGRVLKELVDKDDVLAGGLQGVVHILDEHLVVVHDFHAASAQNEGGTDHQGISYPLGGGEGVLDAVRHAGFRLRNAELLHDFVEEFAVFRQRDRLRRGAEDFDAVGFQVVREVEGSLSAELHDDAQRFFLAVDGEDVLKRQRFEVKFVGSVVVCRDGLGVAVDHDGFQTGVADSESGVHATVVELDALADAVRSAAQDHDLVLGRNFRLVLLIISGIVVAGVLNAGDGDGEPAFLHAVGLPSFPDLVFLEIEDLGEVAVGEAVLLGLDEQVFGRDLSLVFEYLFFQLDQLFHLVKEPTVDLGRLEQFVSSRAFPYRFVEHELPGGAGRPDSLD